MSHLRSVEVVILSAWKGLPRKGPKACEWMSAVADVSFALGWDLGSPLRRHLYPDVFTCISSRTIKSIYEAGMRRQVLKISSIRPRKYMAN